MLSKKFISASRKFSTYKEHVAAPYFRKSFIIYSEPEKCTVTVTGLGFYDIYINGRKITKGLLAPYISNPDDIVYYDEYDVTEYIAEGKNVLGLHLGNGMQNAPGGQIWDFDKADFRGAPRTAFAIEITNKDGSVDIIEADRTVKTAPSPVVFDDLRCGCIYDARKEIPDWSQVKYVDDFWNDAVFAESPRGEKRLCTAEPVIHTRHRSAVSIKKCTIEEYRPKGDVPNEPNPVSNKSREGFLYDFGVNTAGIARLKISGERGRQIDLQFGEYINPDGEPSINNIHFFPEGYSQRDIYILKGEGEELFEPVFTYHGFRYCVVLGITEEEAVPSLLTAIECSSALRETGTFSCSDETANELQKITRNSDLSNFYYFPTDCPHREKNGWTGDAALSCKQILMNLDAEKSYVEWLRNIRKAQREDGALPGIIPTGGWGFSWGSGPAWDSVLTILPYYLYTLRGNKEVLKENATAIFRYCEYISQKRNSRGLLEYGLSDWCPVTKLKVPLEFTDSVVCVGILNKASYIFEVLSLPLQKAFCDALAESIRNKIRHYHIDFSTMTATGACQTAQAMAIYFDIFENGEKAAAFKTLLKIIERDNEHIDFGIFGARVLFRVLSDFGESDLAFKMITRPDYPSYGNLVKRGFTTLPEAFFRENITPPSLNHHMYGDISGWFIEYIGGIKVNPYLDNAAFVRVCPHFVKKLNLAESSYDSIGGKISVKWERLYSGIRLTVNCPENAVGEIKLFGTYCFENDGGSLKPLKSGVYMVKDPDSMPDNIIEL